MHRTTTIKSKLIDLGWNTDDLFYEQTIPSTNSDAKAYRPAVILTHNGYCIGIIDAPPLGELLPDFSKRFFASTRSLALFFLFIFFEERFYRLDASGELHLCEHGGPTLRDIISEATDSSDANCDHDLRFAQVKWSRAENLRLPQILAITRTIDAILQGKKCLSVSMTTGTGKTITQAALAAKLLNSGFAKRVLAITPSLALVRMHRELYSAFGLSVSIHGNETTLNDQQIVILTPNKLLSIQDGRSASLVQPSEFDIIIADEAQFLLRGRLKEELEIKSHQVLVGFSAHPLMTPPFVERPIFEYSIEDALEEPAAPPGYEAFELGSIALVSEGLPKVREKSAVSRESVYLLSARNLRDDGTITLDERLEIDHDSHRRFEVLENDILISTAGAVLRVVLVRSLDKPAVFGSSLLRVRSRDSSITLSIFDFLSSDIGTSTLNRLAYGAVLRHLDARALTKVLVYLPTLHLLHEDLVEKERDGDERQAKRQLRMEIAAINVLRNEVIPQLEENARAAERDPEYSSPSQNELVAARLRRLAIELAGSDIGDIVLDSFPFPIAIAYRRYVDSRFNVFERVLRLRDLAESCGFFLYNVCLADYFINLSHTGYTINDKGARRAYSGFSMAARIDFIEEILNGDHKNQPLFLAELPSAQKITSNLRIFQEDLRNSLSHTAAASESQQNNILNEFTPRAMELLHELNFITKYNMVRIPSYHTENGKLYRRLEVYSGVSPHAEEQEISSPYIATEIGKDHIAILGPEGSVLNLHPLYQLISNRETRHETHLCFFKQRKKGLLEGESIQGSFYVELNGGNYFDNLIPSE